MHVLGPTRKIENKWVMSEASLSLLRNETDRQFGNPSMGATEPGTRFLPESESVQFYCPLLPLVPLVRQDTPTNALSHATPGGIKEGWVWVHAAVVTPAICPGGFEMIL